MNYSLANINIKNTRNDSWRLISVTEDEKIISEHGQLFCVAELKQGTDAKVEIVESIVSYILEVFSEQAQENTSRSEDLLEHLLEEVNRKFTEASTDIEPGSFNDFSFVIGIMKSESLVLSSHGSLQAHLLHPFAKKGNDMSYRWVNILENAKNGNGTTSGKLFDQVIAGELAEKQSFIIGTKNVWQVFTQDKLKDLILDNRIRRIKQILVKTINGLPSETDIALLVGKDEPVKLKRKAAVVDTTQDDEKPQDDEKHTALKKLFGNHDKKDKTIDPHQPKKIIPATPISSQVENKISGGKNWFSKLPKKAKITFVIVVVLGVGFIQSLAWINTNNQDEKISVQFDERMQEIQSKRDEAEAKLIYNDKESARTLIMEALELTYKLPERYEKEGEQKKEIEDELKETLLEIDGLETLQSIQSVFTFSPETAPKVVHNIIALRSGLMVVVTDKASMSVIDVPNQTANNVTLDGIQGTIDDATWDKETKTLYALTNENKVFEIPLNNLDLTDTSISTKELGFSIADIGDPSTFTFYANKLYAIDAADRQIKKLGLSDNSVSTWLSQEQAGLGAVIDLVIDGNIFIATQNEVTQYFKGNKTEWAISGLTPLPSTIVDIHADLDDQYIYLLDNSTTRLIIANESGLLFKQFTSPQLISPASFSVNEATREIYILDGQTIFRVPITWLAEITEE